MKMTDEVVKKWCIDFLREYKRVVEAKHAVFMDKLPLYFHYPPIIHIYLTKEGDYFEAVFEARRGEEQIEPEISICTFHDTQTLKVNAQAKAEDLNIRGKFVSSILMNQYQFSPFFYRVPLFAHTFIENELARLAPLKEKFKYIDSEKLRQILERDYMEAEISYQANAYKGTILLCGSIVEALLLHFLKKQKNSALATLKGAFPRGPRNLEDCHLFHLIEVAHRLNVISDAIKKLSDLIHEYRNLIHPSVEMRESIEPDENLASIARSLLRMVLKDIEERFS